MLPVSGRATFPLEMSRIVGEEAVDAVLLDLDGTLIKFAHNYEHFLQRTAGSLGVHDPADPFFAAYSKAIIAEGPVTLRSAVGRAVEESGRDSPRLPDRLCEPVYGRGTHVNGGQCLA